MNIWIFNHYAQGPGIPGGKRHFNLARQLILKDHSVIIFAAGFHPLSIHQRSYLRHQKKVKYYKDGYNIEV